jgi:N-acetylneuraminic acid mutarotase
MVVQSINYKLNFVLMRKIPASLLATITTSILLSFSPSGSNNFSGYQKLPVPFCMPQVVNAKTKFYILSQGNSEYFRNIIHLSTNNLPDTSVLLYEFTPATAIMKKVSDVGIIRTFFGTTYNNGKIYLAGGADNTGKATKTLLEFDIVGKKWSVKPNMNQARAGLALECFDNKVYAISGEPNSSVEMFDIAQNKWQMLDLKSSNTIKCMSKIIASSIIDNKIYLFGYDGLFQIINLSGLTIENGPQTIFRLDYFDAVVYNRRIYLTSGANADGIDNSVYSFNSIDNTWTKAGRSTTARCGSGLVYFGSMLLYLGGSTENISKQTQLADDIYIYRPSN